MTKRTVSLSALAALILAAVLPTTALAYTGPGAGISAIGSLLALLAAIGFMIVGFVWYPIKRLIKGTKKAPAATAAAAETGRK